MYIPISWGPCYHLSIIEEESVYSTIKHPLTLKISPERQQYELSISNPRVMQGEPKLITDEGVPQYPTGREKERLLTDPAVHIASQKSFCSDLVEGSSDRWPFKLTNFRGTLLPGRASIIFGRCYDALNLTRARSLGKLGLTGGHKAMDYPTLTSNIGEFVLCHCKSIHRWCV